MKTRRLPSNSRKLLIASLGIASVSYVVACGSESPSSGNLMSINTDASTLDAPTSGNLMGGTTHDAALDAPTSGNLMGYPPDAGDDAASDASDDAADGHD